MFENVVFKNLGPPAPTPAPPGPPGPTAPPSPTTTGVSRSTLITILLQKEVGNWMKNIGSR